MWPSGQGFVPFMPPNLTFYNSQAYPKAQSQQLVPYRTHALRIYDLQSNPDTYNLQGSTDVTLLPYSHQKKWENAVRLQQDVMAGGMVIQKHDSLSQYCSRENIHPEHMLGEVVPRNLQGAAYTTTLAPYLHRENMENAMRLSQDAASDMVVREQDWLSQDRNMRERMQSKYMMEEMVPQNLQGAAYMTTFAPYSHQKNMENAIGLSQKTVGGIVLCDQNWLLQAHNRGESMQHDYKIEEVVMVKCSKRKWLPGVIQRMSAHGMRIWIFDAHLLVNVPLELLSTHVFKMSTNLELQTLPSSKPMFPKATIDNKGCRRLLVQCVRPAHLSHRQLYRMSHCLVCVLCKTPLSMQSNIVKPWNCSHQVHNHCLHLQMQHTSTIVCPTKSCNQNNTHQLVSSPSTYAGSMNGFSNGQLQQHLDVLCVCGFKASMTGVDDLNKPIFCPNCNQPANVNQITIALPSKQPSVSRVLPHSFLDAEGEIDLQRASVHQNSKWHEHTFSGPTRLEAIKEGPEIPPLLEDSLGVELHDVDEGAKEIESPKYCGENLLLTCGEKLQNQNGFDSKGVATRFVKQDVQPFSCNSQHVSEDGQSVSSAFEQPLVVEPHGMDEGGKESDPLWHRGENLLMTFSKNYQNQNGSDSQVVEARFADQDAQPSFRSQIVCKGGNYISYASSPSRITLIENEESKKNAPTTMEFVIGHEAFIHVNCASPTKVEEDVDRSIENLDENNKPMIARDESDSGVEASSLWRRKSTVDWTRGNDDDSKEASSSNRFAIISPTTLPVYVNHFSKFVKIDDSSKKPNLDKTTTGDTTISNQRQTLWRRASAIDWARLDAEESEEASSSLTDYDTNITPTISSLHVNHFVDFVKLAMSSASTAKDILASASSSLIAKIPPSETPALPLIAPAPALLAPARTLITPTSALFARAPGLITQAPAWVSVIKNPEEGSASSAWITVIKDGKDARNDDSRWELDRMVKTKEDKFM